MARVKATRRDRAARTRLKIVRSAHAEFVEKGYHGSTIASIAERAGVAAQTVYFVFNNKPALMSAVIDNAVLGEDEPTVPQESAWWASAQATPDAAEALRLLIRGAAPIFERTAAISEVLRAAATDDDDLWAVYDHHERLRATGYAQMVELIATKGALRTDPATATDVLLTVYGDATYVRLTEERGWTHDRVVDWLCDAMPRLLLDDRPARRSRIRPSS